MALGFLLLCGLSLWQWQRLEWKSDINQARLLASKGEPVSLNLSLPASPLPDFTPVTVTGKWLRESEVFVLARTAKQGEFGYHVLTPLKTNTGEVVIVDRGWLPEELKGSQEALAATDGTVNGYARNGQPKRNFFVPDNNPATDFWSHINIAQMAEAMGITTADYYIQATNQTATGMFPKPQEAQITLRNEHFQYAITWLFLAFTLLGMFVIASYTRKQD